MRTVAILPVKSFTHGKRRLRHEVSASLREALVQAMLEDVLDALSGTNSIEEVLVVTVAGPAGSAARQTAARFGATVIEDREEGHNQAAHLGIAAALQTGADRVLLVPGDCPALNPDDVDDLLARADPPPSLIVVPDRHGTGTNALVITPPDAVGPSFGPGSRARHEELARAAGLSSRVVKLPSLALDVDTPDDLRALADAGDVAPRTLALLSRC